MIDLILHIYEKISADPSILEHSEKEIDNLIADGIIQSDAKIAFEHAATCYLHNDVGKNIRYLSDDEVRLLTPGSCAFLMNLQLTGIIQPMIVDLILTRFMLFNESPVDVGEIKQLVDFVMMNPNENKHHLTFDLLTYRLPDGELN